MGNDQLLEYVLEGRQSPSLCHWVGSSRRFASFVDKYRDKIRGKIRDAVKNEICNRHSVDDVIFELYVAYLVLQCNIFTDVVYESKYTIGNERSPDFAVTYDSRVTFNMEVKRIRESPNEVALAEWKQEVRHCVSTIPSSLAISVRVVRDFLCCEPTKCSEWLNYLRSKTPDIVAFVGAANAIHEDRGDIMAGEDGEPQSVPGFEGAIEVVFRKPSRKLSCTLDWYGGDFPVFNTQREYRKFGDVLASSLGQMVPGMVNVLVIGTNSNTHGSFGLGRALIELAGRVYCGDDDFFRHKGFCGVKGFLAKTRRLSGILFRSAWVPVSGQRADEPTTLWCNCDAEHGSLLPSEIAEALEAIG
jgi:hypothetical protein